MDRVRVCGEEEVAERRAGGSDERLGRVGGFGVEDVEGQEDGGVVRGKVGRERKDEALVPGRLAPASVVGAGGGAAGGVQIDDDVGAEVAATPVDVLQVLPRDDCNLQVERLRRPRWWRRRHRRLWRLELGVGTRRRKRVRVLVWMEGRGGRWRRRSHGTAAVQLSEL